MGESTGAGVIFGATGGVMEAALRTAYELVTGKELEQVDFNTVRGVEGVKEDLADVVAEAQVKSQERREAKEVKEAAEVSAE